MTFRIDDLVLDQLAEEYHSLVELGVDPAKYPFSRFLEGYASEQALLHRQRITEIQQRTLAWCQAKLTPVLTSSQRPAP